MKHFWILLYAIAICLFLSACGNNAKIPISAEEYVGADYETVMSDLQKAGFNNIEIEEVEDLTSSSPLQDGGVGQISIDGDTAFDAKTVFPKDAKVLITYHTIKKLPAPLSSAEAQGYDYRDVGAMFVDAGFTNVQTDEVFDMDPDSMEAEFRNEVVIASVSFFEKDEEFPFDSEILVVCHRPYEKHSVKIHIDFIPNWIFSTYNVDFVLDGEQYALEHGEDADYEFELKEDIYTLTFSSSESSSVKGEITLDVACDIEAAYQISCTSDKILVEEEYIDRDTELASNETKVTVSASEYKYKHYEEVVASLEGAGFTNVKTEVLYDIVLGWTDDGETDGVTIDGKSDFTRGDIFAKNTEVIVTYHTLEENDPEKLAEEKDERRAEEEATKVYTVDNCEELEKILSMHASSDPSYVSFAGAYAGKIIEFDGRIDYVANHGDFDTRYDVLLSAGDYDPDSQSGPTFKFEDVNHNDLKVSIIFEEDVWVGRNVKIKAKVRSFDSNLELFYLEPISVSGR